MPPKDALARCLIPVADSIRDLRTQFGLRPYVVRIVRTKWTFDERGGGVEFVLNEFVLLPTPKVSDLSGLMEIASSVGLDETGGVFLSEVSGRITEDQLRGLDTDGSPVPEDEQVYYEIEFQSPSNRPNARRRFALRSAPTYLAGKFQWQFRLEKANEDRSRSGEPR